MKVFVWTDDEGNFSGCHLSDRETIWEVIHDIDYGNLWGNKEDDIDYNPLSESSDYNSLSEDEWLKFINQFQTEARIGIIDV